MNDHSGTQTRFMVKMFSSPPIYLKFEYFQASDYIIYNQRFLNLSFIKDVLIIFEFWNMGLDLLLWGSNLIELCFVNRSTHIVDFLVYAFYEKFHYVFKNLTMNWLLFS